MIKALCTYVTTKLTGHTIGTNLFAGEFGLDGVATTTQTPQHCIADPYGTLSSEGCPEVKTTPILLISRGATHQATKTAANAIHGLLTGMVVVSLSGWVVYTIVGPSPGYKGQDAEGRRVFQCELTVRAKKES